MTSEQLKIDKSPYLAILRGVTPEEVLGIANVLLAVGVSAIEVTFNSPDATTSIARLHEAYSGEASIGAGTVLTAEHVDQAANAGARFIVSPDLNPDVIEQTLNRGLMSVPGVFTPTEAFTALRLGAHALKYFPAELCGPSTIKAWRAVLPTSTCVIATGGITPETVATWLESGCKVLGLGSALYKPGMSVEQVAANAEAFITAFESYQSA